MKLSENEILVLEILIENLIRIKIKQDIADNLRITSQDVGKLFTGH